MTVAITGGAGFVGHAIAERLAKSEGVTIIDRRPPIHAIPNTEYVECDILDRRRLAKALANADVVIHAAIVQIPEINEAQKTGYEVNVTGTQNVCHIVEESRKSIGLILCGSWHVLGEAAYPRIVDETSPYGVNSVEERSRLYVLSKLCQEAIVRFYDEFSRKDYVIIRSGTVLGEGMPEKTAANLFVSNAVNGRPLTVFSHSMHRPMLYVDISDLCAIYERSCTRILERGWPNGTTWPNNIVGAYYPKSITVLQVAEIVKEKVEFLTEGRTKPEIRVVDTDERQRLHTEKGLGFQASVERAHDLLGEVEFISPSQSLERLIANRLGTSKKLPQSMLSLSLKGDLRRN